MNSFLKLNNKIYQILKEQAIIEFTSVQEQVLPLFMKSKDLIVQSQTGTGKTLAFLIPIINDIYKNKTKIHSLILVPTRELAIQIQNVINIFKDIKCKSFIGGSDIKLDEISLINDEIDIVVSTPGRLNELISIHKNIFSKIKYLIFDEADKLLSYGFKPVITSILQYLPKDRCTGLFSATINNEISSLGKLSLKNPIIIKIKEEQNTPDNLTIKYIITSPYNKLKHLNYLITNSHCIVFFATCSQVDYFGELFIRIGYKNIYKIHGKMPQPERNLVYDKFTKNNGILFCTDVSARGIDFKKVNRVIHWDIPGDSDVFIHRSGRTGRNKEIGEAIAFLMENESKYVNYLKIKKINIEEFKEIKEQKEIKYEELKKYFNEDLLNQSVKAFVSYIQYYKKHSLNYILCLSELNFNSIVALHFLDKIPKMKEIENILFKRFVRSENTNKKLLHKKKKYKKKFCINITKTIT